MTKEKQLEQIRVDILDSNICPNLAQTATQLVMGDGNPDADVLFIGEAPGAKEDEQGLPFVGAAGKFLDEMLASIDMKRSDVYITNIVKYRPPNNRDPEPEEKAEFLPFLHKQIAVIQPKLIIPLGRHSMNAFLPELKISQVHGEPKRKSGMVYLPLYHPAAALYNGGMRQTLLEDFAKIPTVLDLIDNN
ncbi:MAG: uracil-DNA glycosylase [Candidatus Saccharimonadales bacterium]|nr:uracil-DNA glycosylase [Candidatus Saccharimonadales bacterium]